MRAGVGAKERPGDGEVGIVDRLTPGRRRAGGRPRVPPARAAQLPEPLRPLVVAARGRASRHGRAPRPAEAGGAEPVLGRPRRVEDSRVGRRRAGAPASASTTGRPSSPWRARPPARRPRRRRRRPSRPRSRCDQPGRTHALDATSSRSGELVEQRRRLEAHHDPAAVDLGRDPVAAPSPGARRGRPARGPRRPRAPSSPPPRRRRRGWPRSRRRAAAARSAPRAAAPAARRAAPPRPGRAHPPPRLRVEPGAGAQRRPTRRPGTGRAARTATGARLALADRQLAPQRDRQGAARGGLGVAPDVRGAGARAGRGRAGPERRSRRSRAGSRSGRRAGAPAGPRSSSTEAWPDSLPLRVHARRRAPRHAHAWRAVRAGSATAG